MYSLLINWNKRKSFIIYHLLCSPYFDIISINPLTSPGEGVTVFTSPYLSAGAPALGEAKGLISIKNYLNNFRTMSK